MSIVLDGSLGITTPDLASGPVAGTTANFSGALTGAAASFSGNVTLGSSVLATPSGSAPSYTCRAWCNFDGTTSPGTIRASGNVSSVTKSSTGNYTINFTTAMPDANYCPVVGISQGAGQGLVHQLGQGGPDLNSNNYSNFGTSSLKIVTGNSNTSVPQDPNSVNVSIFR